MGQEQAGLPANPPPGIANPQLGLFANLLREAGPNRQPEVPNHQPNVVADAQPVAYPGYVRNAFGSLDWVGIPAPPASPEPPAPPALPPSPVAYPGYVRNPRNPFRNPNYAGVPAPLVLAAPPAPPTPPVADNMPPPPGDNGDQDEEGQRLFRQVTAALEALVAYETNRANRGGGPHPPM